MELIAPDKKMICTSRSFGESQTELEPIQEAISTFAARCAEKLRRQSENNIQGSLFDNVDRDKHSEIMKTLDYINSKYGRDTVKLAIQGSGQKWKLRQEKLSPRYTTSWNDIIKVRV